MSFKQRCQSTEWNTEANITTLASTELLTDCRDTAPSTLALFCQNRSVFHTTVKQSVLTTAVQQYMVSLSLVFCCYQQLYDIFNMSRWVILQMRGHDGVSTPQNGAAAYSQSHISHICQGGFPLPSLWFSSSWVSFSYGRSSLTAEAFLWPHCR